MKSMRTTIVATLSLCAAARWAHAQSPAAIAAAQAAQRAAIIGNMH